MSPAIAALFLLLVAGVGRLATGKVRAYALRHRILDQPTARSLHEVPTPRGGGLGIIGAVLPAVALLAWGGLLPAEVAVALAGGGIAVGWIGWLDDKVGVTPGPRAGVHLVAALWALYWLGGFPSMEVASRHVSLGHWGLVIGALGTVWLVNLYNFMDGIDGLAGAEAVCLGLGGGLLLLHAGSTGLGVASLALAAGSAGFLTWNWAPAKIFMGDVGSGFLGFVLAGMAIASENQARVPLLVWILLLGVFVFDATATLVRRIWRRDRWYMAHREHAYQRLVRAGWTHARVTTAIVAVNLLLFALAAAGYARRELLPLSLLIGSAVLAGLYLAVERVAPMSRRPDADR